jgi:tRNA-dihydrouridine synthase B
MRICLAPMDGITDLAYRTICKEIFLKHWNPADELMLWTEFMSAEWYKHNPKWVVKHLRMSDFEPKLIAQIFGGTTDPLLTCATDVMTKYPFAGIEINMGCPSPSVMKCDAGSAMLKDKPKTLWILKQIHEQLNAPLSLKTRAGLTQDDKNAQFDFVCEASKYVRMITIHARTYNQSHAGEVDRNFVYKLKESLPDKIIIGNGGIRSYDDAVAQVHNLDGIMIGQSAIGNPWILTPHTPTIEQKYTTIFRHLDIMMASERLFQERLQTMDTTLSLPTYQELEEIMIKKPRLTDPESTSRVAFEFRKYLFNYVSWLEGNKALKQQIPHWKEYTELKDGLEKWFATTLHIQK